jgi:hypothetical protein
LGPKHDEVKLSPESDGVLHERFSHGARSSVGSRVPGVRQIHGVCEDSPAPGQAPRAALFLVRALSGSRDNCDRRQDVDCFRLIADAHCAGKDRASQVYPRSSRWRPAGPNWRRARRPEAVLPVMRWVRPDAGPPSTYGSPSRESRHDIIAVPRRARFETDQRGSRACGVGARFDPNIKFRPCG